MATQQPLYAILEEPTFRDDCRYINPNPLAFDTLFFALKELLERDPWKASHALGDDTDIRYVRSREHFAVDDMPAMYVTLRIEGAPPDGTVTLRRVVMEADLRAGLHL